MVCFLIAGDGENILKTQTMFTDNVLRAGQSSVDFLASCAFSLSVNLIPTLFFILFNLCLCN